MTAYLKTKLPLSNRIDVGVADLSGHACTLFVSNRQKLNAESAPVGL